MGCDGCLLARPRVTDISERARSKVICNSTALLGANPTKEGPAHGAPQKAWLFPGRMVRPRSGQLSHVLEVTVTPLPRSSRPC